LALEVGAELVETADVGGVEQFLDLLQLFQLTQEYQRGQRLRQLARLFDLDEQVGLRRHQAQGVRWGGGADEAGDQDKTKTAKSDPGEGMKAHGGSTPWAKFRQRMPSALSSILLRRPGSFKEPGPGTPPAHAGVVGIAAAPAGEDHRPPPLRRPLERF